MPFYRGGSLRTPEATCPSSHSRQTGAQALCSQDFPALSLEGLPTGQPFIKGGAFGMLRASPHPPTPPPPRSAPTPSLLPVLLFPKPLLLLLGFPQGLLTKLS